MAAIEKRRQTLKDSSLGEVRWRVRYLDPSRRERSKSFKKKSDAEKFAAIVESDKARGVWLDPGRADTPLSEWVESWFASIRHGLKPKTVFGYRNLLDTRILPRFGDQTIGSIEPVAVRQWVSELSSEISASRTRQAYRLLAAMLKSAVESNYIGRSPCIGVKLPRLPHKEMAFLTAAQVDQLADAVPERYRLLIYVLSYGGTRWGETVAIRRSRCDLLRGRIQVSESISEVAGKVHYGTTKTNEQRWISLPLFLRAMLEEHLDKNVPSDPDALIFTLSSGGPIRHAGFRYKTWLPALETAGLPKVRIHDLRHTCAALLIAAGANPKLIQSHLGHSTIEVTFDRYGHLFPDAMDRLAEALDDTFNGAKSGGLRPIHGLRESRPASDNAGQAL